jgi:hypothetical protein
VPVPGNFHETSVTRPDYTILYWWVDLFWLRGAGEKLANNQIQMEYNESDDNPIVE